MRTLVLDAGAFIASERRDRAIATFLQAADDESADILIPATVLAEVWREPPRHQSNALVRAANAIVPLDGRAARDVGALLGRSGTKQLADAHVVTVAIAAKPSIIATSDPEDIIVLLKAAGVAHSTRTSGSADVRVHEV